MRSWVVLVALLAHTFLSAQVDTASVPNSENGWSLSPHGTIRVLLIFAEIDYDKNPNKDPQPGGAEHWPKGKLPIWKDEVFEPFHTLEPKASVTRYYHDISLGQFEVLGDYIDEVVVIPESVHKVSNGFSLGSYAVKELASRSVLKTHHNLTVSDFDMWKRGGKPGMPKASGPDDPHSYDHVMVIVRNSNLTHGQGSVDSGSPGKLFGYESDSQSRFGAMYGIPFDILKHEFNHLLLGGNNFHSGGGNAAQFQSYFICQQGGWSIMGAANSSLLSASAWDRDRLGWRATDACQRINARSTSGQCISGDLDPMQGDTGIFKIRDFVTSGDALRIRMPFLEQDVLPQWLWIENHQTFARNGSPTDRFHWEEQQPCAPRAEPGLYMTMQVDRDNKSGKDIYGGAADYLRPVPASGNYDLELTGDTIKNSCPFGGSYLAYRRAPNSENPLAGNHEQELPVYDKNKDGILKRGDHWIPGSRIEPGNTIYGMVFTGVPDHAFRMNGKRKIAMGTNPSTANMMTLVSGNGSDSYKRGKPNVRTVYLNGISVELLDMDATGTATILVRTNDTGINEDVRWCADSIVLSPLRGSEGYALSLAPGKRLLLDRSRTPTRINDPEERSGTIYFSSPTKLVVLENARVKIGTKASVVLENDSELHLMPGASMCFGTKAKLKVSGNSRLYLHGNASIDCSPQLLKKLNASGKLVRIP